MTGYAGKQINARHDMRRHRRQPRRYLALAIGMAICCLFLLAGALGLTFTRGDDKAVEPDATNHTAGQILVVEPRHCRKLDFNNHTGQLRDGETIPCPTDWISNGEYQAPRNRIDGIRQGFFQNR